jgi:hypothetical protein
VKRKREKACTCRLFQFDPVAQKFNGGGHAHHAHGDAQFLLEWQDAHP